MHVVASNGLLNTFPVVTFRKKRLSVAVHASFDLANGEAVACAKEMIEAALAQLARHGNAKVTYSLVDI